MARTANGATMLYFGGLWEQAVGGGATKYYSFNGDVVALRAPSNAVTFLHGDHLGSVSLATTSAGTVASRQYFDPFGVVRAGSAPTARNFTGQLRDSSGLLYYHARYYDPALGRFISPDSVVPGAGALTASPHDATAQAAWGQRGGGPLNPQALNRYSYVQNNPVNATDTTGHFGATITPVSVTYHMTNDEANSMFNLLGQVASSLVTNFIGFTAAGIPKAIEAVWNYLIPYGIPGMLIATMIANLLVAFGALAISFVSFLSAAQAKMAGRYGDNGLDL